MNGPGRKVFTHARLAALAGVKPGRLRYWESTGLVHSLTAEQSVRGSYDVRLYDFNQALTVLALAELRRENISLQHLRQIVDHLRERKYEVSEVRFGLAGQRLFFQAPDGEWEDLRDPRQIILSEVLDLRPLRQKLATAAARDRKAARAQSEKRRGALGSKSLVAGTRVPVATVKRLLDHGYSTDEVTAAYPSLTREDVAAVRAGALTA